MNLTQNPEKLIWPETHCIYIEKFGPFMNTAAQTWHILQALIPTISAHNEITGFMALYKLESQIYCACVSLSAPPKNLPNEMAYKLFQGGQYARFVLTGSYAELGEASAKVFARIKELKIQMRDDYCIENYVTDPKVTPETENVTQILIPV